MDVFEAAAVPLDVVRRGTLSLATRSRLLTGVVARRDTRVAWLATAQVVALFALALRAPVALFFLGPVVFGVAHLAADVRYLALRRAPPRALLVVSAVLAVVLVTGRLCVWLHVVRPPVVDRLDVVAGMAWVGAGLWLALASRARRAVSVAVGAAFFAVGLLVVSHPRATGVVLVHAHNVLAVALWLVLFRRRASPVAVPIALALAFAALLASGAALPWTFHHGGMEAMGTRLERLGAWMTPGVSLERGAALASVFVFLQGVHYAVWTGWIPQDALRGEGTPTYRQSVRGLVAEFGLPAFSVIVCLALAMVGSALVDVRGAVGWYMGLSRFHAWFELAFFAYFVARGGYRPAPDASPATA